MTEPPPAAGPPSLLGEVFSESVFTDPQVPAPGAGAHPAGRSRIRWYHLAAAMVAVLVVAGVIVGPGLWQRYRQRNTRLNPPATIAGLTLDRTRDAAATAEYLRTAVAAGVQLDNSVAAVYDDPAGKARSVMFFGGTAFIDKPDQELTTLLNLLDDSGTGLSGLHAVPAGRLGGSMRCGTAPAVGLTGGDLPVCGWADQASVGAALFPSRSIDQAADMMVQLRDATEHR